MNKRNWFVEKPKYCCWVLTYRCNFKCAMCKIWQTDDTRKELTLAEKNQCVTELASFVDPSFEFHLSGGEPLLCEGILELIAHIRSCGFRANMVTNGWLVDESLLRALSEAGLSTLTFSLDGATKETHDSVRGVPGSFDRIVRAVEYSRVRTSSMKIAFLTLISGRNLHEIIPLIDWVDRDPAIDMISFQAITQPFSEPRDDRWFRKDTNCLWPRDRNMIGSLMDTVRARKMNGSKIGNHPNHFMAFKNYFDDPNRFLKKKKCTLGDYEFHIDPYGKTFFCCLMEPLGMVPHEAIPTLWKSDQAQKIRHNVYQCRKNCHIMINCFYEDEKRPQGMIEKLRSWIGK